MSLPPQPPSSEEPEQKPILPTSAETSEQTSPVSDSNSNEAEKQPELSASEDVPTQPASAFEPQQEKIETQPAAPATSEEAEAPTQVWSNAENPDVAEAPTQVWSENEVPPADWTDASTPVDENSLTDEDATQVAPGYAQPARTGIFVSRGILIAAAAILVLAILLVSLLFFLNSPKDPPTDWIASYTPTTSTEGKALYYIHWTNQNGDLKGQFQGAGIANGIPQSITGSTTGLYNRDNHIIYVVIVLNGNQDILTGKINDSNDTLTLNPVGATDTTNQLVFHKGSASDYTQQKQKLTSKK